jgi:hypothetical protein
MVGRMPVAGEDITHGKNKYRLQEASVSARVIVNIIIE